MLKRRIIGGRYDVVARTGRSGYSQLLTGRDIASGVRVAVKCLREERATDPRNAERFRREAALASSLQHPNICPVLSHGATPEGELYIVMPLLLGRTLGELVDHRALPPPRAAHLISQVLSALQAAHDAGVVHRDIKPSNVMVQKDDQAILLDFGAAQLEGDGERLTRKGGVIGTAVYMSPEQASGAKVDFRTDLYSTGVMLYEVLTGQRPLAGATTSEVVQAIVGARPFPPPRLLAPSLSPEIEAVVLRGMARDPAHRYGSARDMRTALLLAGAPDQYLPSSKSRNVHFEKTRDLPAPIDICRGSK